jgi:SAM-dependent methyltransferase
LSTFADAVKRIEDLGARRAQDYGEAEKLFDTLPKFDSYLEIGCRHGWTFSLVAQLIKPKFMVGIDLPGVFPWGDDGSEKVLKTVQAEAVLSGIDTHLFFEDSTQQETIASLANLMDGEKFDVLFIDGDHRYDGVKADWENYRQFVKPDGMVIFHDIYPPKKPPEKQIEVDRVWNEITGFDKWEIHEGGSGLGILRYA